MTVKIIAFDPGARWTGIAVLTLADGCPMRLDLDEIEDTHKANMPVKVRGVFAEQPETGGAFVIRNYTSTVSVEKSVANIESHLMRTGVTHIAKIFDDGKIKGFVFQLPVNGFPMTFKLPARPEACEKVLLKDRDSLTKTRWTTEGKRQQEAGRKKLREQAERTAWRILEDWISVNCSLIQLEQAEAVEVFLPYAYNPETDKTLFETAKEGGFKLLASGREKR